MVFVRGFAVLVALLMLATICSADPEDGRTLGGILRPLLGGGGGQTYHYERYGGSPGFFGKFPGYGYESFTHSGGGFGKPFFGHGFGNGYGFGNGFGGGFGHGFYPGYGFPYPGVGYGFGHGFGPGFFK